jgi:enoyl-CoA hydratase/carnithine racemase
MSDGGSDSLTSYGVDERGVALLQLDRPTALNAINGAMIEELIAHIDSARGDDSVRVLVFSSTDFMAFSAGADIKEDLDKQSQVDRMQRFADLYDAVVRFRKPTIAACHGYTVGGGAEIAICCDIRVGGANLQMRFPGADLGVRVGPARLSTLCGLSAAKYLLLSSKMVKADEALRIGLVNEVSPGAATENAALELAGRIAAYDPESVGALKQMLHRWDGIEDRSADEGRHMVEWLRSGPGLS